MISRRTLFRTGAAALGAASIDLSLFAEPVARTSSGWIELDRNENPYGPPESAKKAMVERIARGNRYLDLGELDAFREKIAQREGVTRDHIVLGAGSSEILSMAAREFLGPGSLLVQGSPTYEAIGRMAEQNGARVERIAVTPQQNEDLDGLRKASQEKAGLLYLNWPNNPCGSMVEPAEMRAFVRDRAQRVPVLMDEAYLEWVDPTLASSTVSLVKEGADVIVARTFSKIFGLAGLRMGYGVAQPETAKRLGTWRFSVLNSLALAASSAALSDRAFEDLARKRNDEARKLVYRTFEDRGIRYVPSSANFVWFHEGDRGLATKLRERNILTPNGRFAGGWNRVTVGTAEEMERWAEVVSA